MKKIVILFTILIFMGSTIYGQSDFRFGFQLSPNFSWIANSDRGINGNGSNLGLKLGVMGEKFFTTNENYAFTFGIGFAFNQGGTLKHDVGGNFLSNSLDESDPLSTLPDGVNLKYGIQYIEIPLGLKMRTQEFGYFRYYAEPALTLGIRTQARGAVSGFGDLDTDDIDIKKDVNFLNVSWGIGGGVEYSVGESTSLLGGLVFQSGFIDITDNDAMKRIDAVTTDKEDSKATVNSITIKLGVMF